MQSPRGPAEESEDVGAEVPAAITVEVEDVHPLPEVSDQVCMIGREKTVYHVLFQLIQELVLQSSNLTCWAELHDCTQAVCVDIF